MTIADIITKHNISDATLKNWHKLNYIKDINNITEEELNQIIQKKDASRRNKKNSLETIIPKTYLSSESSATLLQQLLDLKDTYEVEENTLLFYIIKKVLANKFTPEIETEVKTILGNIVEPDADFLTALERMQFNFSSDDDFIGALYMSLKSIGDRTKTGVFYTPAKIVDLCVSKIDDIYTKNSICDPACGSGNFLIKIFNKLSERFDEKEIISKIYGIDIDPTAVLICKLNLYNLTKNINFNEIHILNEDFLFADIPNNFDVIIGNPPWGAKYLPDYINKLTESYSKIIARYDSFALFIHNSLNHLNENGSLIFILPSSIINIERHEAIRQEILQYSISEIADLGRQFSEVYTDTVLFKMIKSDTDDNSMIYNGKITEYRDIFNNNPYTSFLVPSNPISKSILDKIKNADSYFLNTNNIKYCLGIVTGNNKDFIRSVKEENYEPVVSGKNLEKFYVNSKSIEKYILYRPEKFQQVADTSLYRSSNKILYKFVGKKLTFAYDTDGLLSLNSANVISLPDDLDGYYITAILNSRLTQLFFDEYYNTHKVLKNHIQHFPIYNLPDNLVAQIVDFSKQIIKQKNYLLHYEDIEDILYTNLELTNNEIDYLRKNIN